MRQFLVLATALSLIVGVAHAQVPMPGLPALPGLPHTSAEPGTPRSASSSSVYSGFRPGQPPKIYGTLNSQEPTDGPFSPAGEAKRARQQARAEQARQNGEFSPAAGAKRDIANAKRDAALNPFGPH